MQGRSGPSPYMQLFPSPSLPAPLSPDKRNRPVKAASQQPFQPPSPSLRLASYKDHSDAATTVAGANNRGRDMSGYNDRHTSLAPGYKRPLRLPND